MPKIMTLVAMIRFVGHRILILVIVACNAIKPYSEIAVNDVLHFNTPLPFTYFFKGSTPWSVILFVKRVCFITYFSTKFAKLSFAC